LAIAAAFVLSLPWWAEPRFGRLAFQLFINIILAVTLRAIWNVGQLNVAHVTFMGFGAYTVAALMTKTPMSFWLALPLAGVVTALLAVLVGISTLRVKGIYFVIITLGFAEFVRLLIGNLPVKVLGGWTGITWIPIPKLFGWEFSSYVPYYYLGAVLMAGTVLLFYRVDRSRIGISFQMLRESESLAESVGINSMKYKVTAFVMASLFAGLAGGLWASFYRNVTPDEFSFWATIPVITYIVIGGTRTVAGSIAGAVFITLALEFLKPLKLFVGIGVGMLLIVTVLLMPDGLERVYQKIKDWIARPKARPS